MPITEDLMFKSYSDANITLKSLIPLVTGLNFSPQNSALYSSLVLTRLSLAFPFTHVYLQLCVSLTQRGSHNFLVISK